MLVGLVITASLGWAASASLGQAVSAGAGEDVYVTNYDTHGHHGVSQYTVGAGGELQPDATPLVAVADTSAPAGIVESPSGQYVYVVTPETAPLGGTGPGEVWQYTVGPGGMLSATPTTIATAGVFPIGIAMSSDGQDVYVVDEGKPTGVSQFTVGAAGVLTPDPTATVKAGAGPVGIAIW
jgi:DNA-binding beta-propeller fold protein YncE